MEYTLKNERKFAFMKEDPNCELLYSEVLRIITTINERIAGINCTPEDTINMRTLLSLVGNYNDRLKTFCQSRYVDGLLKGNPKRFIDFDKIRGTDYVGLGLCTFKEFIDIVFFSTTKDDFYSLRYIVAQQYETEQNLDGRSVYSTSFGEIYEFIGYPTEMESNKALSKK